ncbi:MAG: hypothetical protein RIS72_1292 [Pseudomonadota bacterium]|jgi:hypothetical protein
MTDDSIIDVKRDVTVKGQVSLAANATAVP